jgi:acetate kinase
MGFTPLDGLMMGTRSGAVDPSILTYLMRQNHVSDKDLDDTLNKHSGLLGISGLSEDMREIVAAIKKGSDRAQLAFDMYIHRLRAGIASMAAALGGVDGLIFTAGVGEHSSEVRAATCEDLGFLGIRLDPEKNIQSRPDGFISMEDSDVPVLIVSAQEDWAIAGECWKLMRRPENSARTLAQ